MKSHAGIGMDIINPLRRCKYNSPIQTVLKDIEAKESAREEMRLLYVALTRAREKLYAVGTLDSADKFEITSLPLIKELTANEILSANSYMSLISLAYARGGSKYWNLNIVAREDVADDVSEEKSFECEFVEDKKISDLLDFEYPYKKSVSLPNKASVSFLKTQDFNLAPSEDGKIPLLNIPSSKKISLKKPDFNRDTERGTFFGNAHHKLLQYIDYNGASVSEQCKILYEKGILTEEEFSVIKTDKIEEFMDSELGKMLKKADRLYREEAFVISLSAKEIDPSLPESDSICVQGIIDCYFEYNGDIILLDYKTDVYENPSEIVEKYKKQLYYYEIALKKRFKDKIIQKYLYLMHKNDIIELQEK